MVQAMEANGVEKASVGGPWTAEGDGLTVCGEAFRGLLERRGVRDPEELARLLGDIDYPMDADEIRRQLSGEEELDPSFPGALACVLGADLWEETELARACVHGQMVCRIAP